MDTVSVIIPTYNRADKLRGSIKSVLNQTYSDLRVIIVDDASVDDTAMVVSEINDERISYYKLERNVGAAGARNEGVKMSDSELIAFHDSDDIWHLDKLEKQVNYLNNHADVDMVYGKIKFISGDEVFVRPDDDIIGDLEGDVYPWLLVRNTIGTPAMLLRKKSFEDVCGFDDSLRCLEDWEFVLRFARKYKIGYMDDILVDSYDSAGSVSWNIGGAFYDARCKMIAMHKDEMLKYGILDEMIMDIFGKAEKAGLLTQVQKMLMGYLKMYS